MLLFVNALVLGKPEVISPHEQTKFSRQGRCIDG
jgi:hypothetical protein